MIKNETFIRLIIQDENLEYITNKLNIVPTMIHKKNDLISKVGIIKYKKNEWIYECVHINVNHMEDVVNDFFLVFLEKKQELIELSSRADIELSIICYLENGFPSFHLDRQLLNFCTKINAEIDIDLYHCS